MLLVFGAVFSVVSFFLGLVGLVSADYYWSYAAVNQFWTMAIINHPFLIGLASICFTIYLSRRKIEEMYEEI